MGGRVSTGNGKSASAALDGPLGMSKGAGVHVQPRKLTMQVRGSGPRSMRHAGGKRQGPPSENAQDAGATGMHHARFRRGRAPAGLVSWTLGLGQMAGGAVVMYYWLWWITGYLFALLLVAVTLQLPMITFRFYMAARPTYTRYTRDTPPKQSPHVPIPSTYTKTPSPNPKRQATPPPSTNPTAPPPRTSQQRHRR